MVKISKVAFAAMLSVGSLGFAFSSVPQMAVSNVSASSISHMIRNGVVFKVGDTLNANLKIVEANINGTVKIAITALDATTVTIQEDADLQIQKQVIVMVINKTNGKVISVTVNGQPQQVPTSNPKIVKQETATVTVPAGTYACLHLVLDDNGNQSEIWADPKDIPINGLLKEVGKQQGYTVEMELTSFAFGA